MPTITFYQAAYFALGVLSLPLQNAPSVKVAAAVQKATSVKFIIQLLSRVQYCAGDGYETKGSLSVWSQRSAGNDVWQSCVQVNTLQKVCIARLSTQAYLEVLPDSDSYHMSM